MVSFTVYTLLFCMFIMLFYMLYGSTDVFNKVLAFNNFSTQVILFITAMSIILNNFFLLDMALLYASISFISTVSLMKLMLF